MKKHLSSIIKDEGFILLHVLFIVSLVFILITSSIAAYRNEIYITERQIDQIKIETLFQMAQAKYRKELDAASEKEPFSASYIFPDGMVDITVTAVKENYVKLHFIIRFDDSDAFFPMNHLLRYEQQKP